MNKNKDKEAFYQSKYEYYRSFSFWVVIIGCLLEIVCFVSDCQLYGRFAYETFVSRIMIILPAFFYVVEYRKNKSYKKMGLLSYVLVHCVMWTTIMSTMHLENKSHADAGLIIIHLLFFAVSFAFPLSYSAVAHSLWLSDVLLSDIFIHYEDFGVIISMGIPCIAAVLFASYFMQKAYMENYLNQKKLEVYSFYDPLTKVYNRNILSEIIKENGAEFVCSMGKDIGIVIVDIDYFKKVNDNYGHLCGDKILQGIACCIKEEIRKCDYVIRWGGEEFVIVLPGISLSDAYKMAERLRKKIECTDNGICSVTISAGVSKYDGKDYKNAVNDADTALYRAKENGRNQVMIGNFCE